MNNIQPLDEKLKVVINLLITGSNADLDRLRHEFNHALCVLFWVNKLTAQPSYSLQAAALLHDCDRLFPERRRKFSDYNNYDEYKKAHANAAAVIAREILPAAGIDEESVELIARLIASHESGGFAEADILRDADSLAFFDKNLFEYIHEKGWATTKEKVIFMSERLGKQAKKLLAEEELDGKLLPQFQELLAAQ
jgi:hypothetical protein